MTVRRIRIAVFASLLVLAACVAALAWPAPASPTAKPALVVHCAAALRPPMEVAAREYEAFTGQRIELNFGASEEMLTKSGTGGDLFLPADASYIESARQRGLIGGTFPLATMRLVLLLASGNPKNIATWADLTKPGVRVAVASEGAAAGKMARDHLGACGAWERLKPNVVETGTVNEAANAAKLGAADAAIVWDAVSFQYPKQTVLKPMELEGVVAKVELALLKGFPEGAKAFAMWLLDPHQGGRHFAAAGFQR